MKTLKIFFSETTGPTALIFGIQYHLVEFYQVCSNNSPGAKNGPAPGDTCFTWAYIGRNMKKSSGTRPQLFLLYNLIIPYNTYILT